MPRELVYSLINMMMKEMVGGIEERLAELRAKCSSDIEFIQRTSQFHVRGGYALYCFDNIPVFYTHLWLENYQRLNWTIQAGEPPLDWRQQQVLSPTLGFDEAVTCPACNGRGYQDWGWQPTCGRCGGSGRIKK